MRVLTAPNQMDNQQNLEKVSIENLEKEKLRAEIDILNARLETEYPDKEEKKEGWFSKASVHAGRWSAILLGAVTLFSAIWGVFLPLSEYLGEQQRALEFQLNTNMIGFVDDLNSEDPTIANRGVMMLSYYEENSIPILLFFLEGTQNDQEEFREKIIEAIALIYEDSSNDGIMEIILTKMENTFAEIKDGYKKNNGLIEAPKRRALLNYMELVSKMNLRSGSKSDIEDLYQTIKVDICQTPTLEIDAYGIFSNVCQYLNEDVSCE